MKINRLVLENFSNIDTAMNAHKIVIDFTEAKNKIILLIGPNGSGKTSILSLLTPFATVGGLDIRNSTNLILSGKNGYKEIEIESDGDIYLIKHFYTAKKPDGHSVKSYIMKNGNELNNNGNVTSFKEWVKDELHVELDYLKLIRLGSNVTSMIDLSETERKTFMNKLLSDADIYLNFYKKVNLDLRQLKEMISHAIDKSNRLGIMSTDDVLDSIDNYNIQLSRKQQEYEDLTGQLSISQHTISMIEDSYNLKNRVTELKKKLDKMHHILEKKDYESNDPNYYIQKINDIEKDMIQRKTKIDASNLLIQSYLTRLDELNESFHTTQVMYVKEKENDKEFQSIENEIDKLYFDIENTKKSLTTEKPNISKDEIDTFIVFLKNVQQQLDITYEFGKEPVKKVVTLMKNGKNVMNYINHQLYNLDSSDNIDILLERLKSRFSFSEKDIPNDCINSNCTARRAYIQIANLIHTESDAKQTDQAMLQSMELVYQNITNVITEFKIYGDIILRLPEYIKKDFLIENIFEKLSNSTTIYNVDKMNDLLSLITEYNNISLMEEKKLSLELLLEKFKKMSNLNRLKDQLDTLESDIELYEDKIKSLKQQISDDLEIIDQYNKSLEVYNELKETFSRHDELELELRKLEEEWHTYLENTRLIKDFSLQLQKIKLEIEFIQDKIQSAKTSLVQYNDLQKDLTKYNKIYDEMTLVKESLSSSKGIPLRFVKSYLGNTEEITNELLDIAFNGNIYIDKFKISQSEFTIPFYNKGKLLNDVKLASQGETSFISIALAFALSSQTMHEYNIMLLDEIDSTLDIKFKEKFLKILENQIDRIDAEQCFFITHGNMFSSYPVDILAFGNDENYKGTIKITKS